MYYLIAFLRKYHYLLLFLVLEAVSFILLFRFNSFQGSVWLTSANTCVAEVNRLYADAESYFGLRSINTQLTDMNVRLQMENDRLREALREVTHDTTHTERLILAQLRDYTLIPARVVSNTNTGGNNHYLVIDKGTNHGIQTEMGVIGGGGAVGMVYLTGSDYSLVIPITNPKSNISCRIREQNSFGYLQWSGESLLHAYLDDIPLYAEIQKGQTVETSGYSAVFPPGIFVGRVSGMKNSADGHSYRLDITLGTDFSAIRDVNVIATPYKAEIDTLWSQAAQAKNVK